MCIDTISLHDMAIYRYIVTSLVTTLFYYLFDDNKMASVNQYYFKLSYYNNTLILANFNEYVAPIS